MSKSMKQQMVVKAKLCEQCLDEKFIKSKPNQTHADCPVKNRKFFYTCNARTAKSTFGSVENITSSMRKSLRSLLHFGRNVVKPLLV